MSDPKTFADVDKFAAMVAEKQGWVLNPDREFIDMIIDGLKVNYNRYGYFSCPCRDGSGIREKDKDLICPCEYSRPDIAEFGHCYCGLYLSKEFHSSGKSPKSLPERRP